jgi:hypothetical protein
MLPSLHCQCCEEFLRSLEQLKQGVERGTNIQEEFKGLQQLYQEKILTLSSEGIEPAIAPRWRSLHTEINRTLRLLQTDILFLNASRQATTSQQRQTACLQHIERLVGYCTAMVNLG